MVGRDDERAFVRERVELGEVEAPCAERLHRAQVDAESPHAAEPADAARRARRQHQEEKERHDAPGEALQREERESQGEDRVVACGARQSHHRRSSPCSATGTWTEDSPTIHEKPKPAAT